MTYETPMHWREFIRRLAHHLLLLALIALSSATAPADAAGPRIGFLSPATPEGSALMLEGLLEGLREHGYVEGVNIAVESRYANNRFDRLPNLARELIGLPVDVLVTFVTQATIAARDNTNTIPIVMIGVSDPVASGLVSSLSRPGANVTGTSGMSSDVAAKQLQLLNEAITGVGRIAVLWNPSNRVFQMQLIQETETAARRLGVELQMFEARDSQSIDRAFVAISKEHVSGLNVLIDPTLIAQGAQIAALAAKARLPSISGISAFADAGGLMGYGPSFPELARGAASYIAKILNGARPAELPVERPTKFEFVINMQTAKQIGLVVPASLRLRADRTID